MAIYEMTKDSVHAVAGTTFGLEGVRERADLQRLLRDKVEILAPDTMVIAEEFGEWEESRRRIDLLAIDRDASLVVIELKRTDDGGHMELQAIRYAAMVSAMTFAQAVEAHAQYRKLHGIEDDAEEAILDFLEWKEPEEDRFARSVRIVLASAEFSRELTTAVMWLNNSGLDIKCVRLKPYSLDGRLLLDVQQIIPLPEAAEYQVQMRRKEQSKASGYRKPKDMTTIWQELEAACSPLEIGIARRLHDWLVPRATHVSPTTRGFTWDITVADQRQYPFRVTTDGKVEVQFSFLASKAPFSQESLRRELASRLNQVSGIDISPTKIAGKPTVPLSVLQEDDAFTIFTNTFDWVIRTISQPASPSSPS